MWSLHKFHNALVSIHFHSVKSFLFLSARTHDFDRMLGTGLPVSIYTMKTPIDTWHFSIPQLKEFLTFSVNLKTDINLILLFVSKTSMHRQSLFF